MTDERVLKMAQNKLWMELSALFFMLLILGVVKWRLLQRQRQDQLRQESEIMSMNRELEQKMQAYIQKIEQQQYELKLAAQVFSASSDGIIICDENNRIVDVNDALIVLSGYKRHELIGENPRIFSSHKMKPEFYQQMWHSIHQSGHWHGEIEDFTSKHRTIQMRCAISVIKNENSLVETFARNKVDFQSKICYGFGII